MIIDNWLGDNKDAVLLDKIEDYFLENRVTLEKIDYFEKELKLNLSKFRSKIKNLFFILIFFLLLNFDLLFNYLYFK